MVTTGSTGYEEGVALIQIFQLFFGGTGAVLVLLASVRVVKNHFVAVGAPRMFPQMVLRNLLSITKRAPLPQIHEPPHWALFCVTILSFMIFSFMILGPLPSNDLFVTWKNRQPVVWEKNPWPKALAVYVRAPARFFVNRQAVSRSNLHSKLIEQLSRRAEWSVYFEAEPDVPFMEAVYTIETIQGCGAKLIWITPQMRVDWQQKSKKSEPTGEKVEPILRSVPR